MMTGMPGNMSAKVTEILQQMPTSQLYDILVQFKSLLQQNPDQARTLLLSNPPVAYALLQSQIAMGYVTPNVAKVRFQFINAIFRIFERMRFLDFGMS
jgi:hypothetical protein